MDNFANILWQGLSERYKQQRLTHAQLIYGDEDDSLKQVLQNLATLLLCTNHACGSCQACRLVADDMHPDWFKLQPEKPGSMIKVDQIRELQSLVYTSPQLGHQRFIMIESADKMNKAAANALLKMLEEPPAGVYFVLIAKQLSTIPATIISRCQLWRRPNTGHALDNYFDQIGYDPLQFSADLDNLLNQCESACALAVKWSTQEDFHQLMLFLYAFHAHIIKIKLLNQQYTPFSSLINQLTLPNLFQQLDKINGIIKNLNHTINVNQLLALEYLLLGYKDE